MDNFEQMLGKYAHLSVKVGVNLQPGQNLLIFADVEVADLVRLVVQEAYLAGARHVYVEWNDDVLQHITYQSAPEEAFTEFPAWKAEAYTALARDGVALLGIASSSPDTMRDVDPRRVSTYMNVSAQAMQEFADFQMKRKIRWTVIAAPSIAWATKVFPDVSEREAVDLLWSAIFTINRVDAADPVTAWQRHIQALLDKRAELNQKNYRKLHYRGPGTNLSVELPVNHVWYGGRSKNHDGLPSVANMPTEEVFTLPRRDGVNGTVRATKPLNFSGRLIEGFSFTFKDGKIVDFHADEGADVLKEIIGADEGAQYLGEVALVPVDSPISQRDILFYQTLYDENASCHLAIGRAYPCFKDVEKMSDEEILAAGANMSIMHVDFMIGSEALDIDGELSDGTVEPVFRQGKWAMS